MQQHVGIIGYGMVAEKVNLALNKMSSIPPITVWTRELENNPVLKKHSDEIRILEGEQVLTDFLNSITHLYIASPNVYHFSLIIEALFQNPNLEIMVEKPVCVSHEDALSLTKHPRANQIRVFNQMSFANKMKRIGQAIKDLQPTKIAIKMHCSSLHLPPELSGGGVLMDIGPHALDLLQRWGVWPLNNAEVIFEWIIPDKVDSRAYLEAKYNGMIIEVDLGLRGERFSNEISLRDNNGQLLSNLDFSEMPWKFNDGSRVASLCPPGNLRQKLLENWLFEGGSDCTNVYAATEQLEIIKKAYLNL